MLGLRENLAERARVVVCQQDDGDSDVESNLEEDREEDLQDDELLEWPGGWGRLGKRFDLTDLEDLVC